MSKRKLSESITFRSKTEKKINIDQNNPMTSVLCLSLDKCRSREELSEFINITFKDFPAKNKIDEIFEIIKYIHKKVPDILNDIVRKYKELIFNIIVTYPNDSQFLIKNSYFKPDDFLEKYENQPNLTEYIKILNINVHPEFYKYKSEKILKAYCDSVRGIETHADSEFLSEIFLDNSDLIRWHFRQRF